MALIKCPECGNNISDKAKACIHCGYPMEALTQKNDLVNSENFVKRSISISKLLSDLSTVIKSFIEENDRIKKKRDSNDYSEQYVDYQRTVCSDENFICLQMYLKENKTLEIHKEAICFLLKKLFASELYTNFSAVKTTLENIDFSILDIDTLTYISTRLREKVQGVEGVFNTHHILYAYPIYQVLFYGSSDINSELLIYLNQRQPALKSENKFDGMLKVLPKMNITPSQKVLSLYRNFSTFASNTTANFAHNIKTQRLNFKVPTTPHKDEQKYYHPNTISKRPAIFITIAVMLGSLIFKQWYIAWIAIIIWYFHTDRP